MILTLFYFFLALLLLICIHEYGHFLVARLCGVKVLRFSFGFGRVLFRMSDRKGTEYTWSLWPLGGYVKMLDETEESVVPEERHLAFNNQALWKRTLIVLAGPLFNFIFAFFALWLAAVIGVYSLAPIIDNVKEGSIAAKAGFKAGQEIIKLEQEPIHSWRDFQFALLPYLGSEQTLITEVREQNTQQKQKLELPLVHWQLDPKKPDALASLGIEPFIPRIPPIIGQVVPDMPGQKAGIIAGDRVLAVDGQPITDWMELVQYVQKRPDTNLRLKIERQGQIKNLSLQTGKKETDGQITGFIGLMSQKTEWPKEWLRLQQESPIAALGSAAKKTWHLSTTTLVFIGRLISGKLSLQTVSGPVGIAQGAGESGKSGIAYYLAFLALVSISLGVLNLLPIPMLDGGHLLFYLIEMIKGTPVSEHTREAFTYAGLVLLIGLMALALSNDITRLTS